MGLAGRAVIPLRRLSTKATSRLETIGPIRDRPARGQSGKEDAPATSPQATGAIPLTRISQIPLQDRNQIGVDGAARAHEPILVPGDRVRTKAARGAGALRAALRPNSTVLVVAHGNLNKAVVACAAGLGLRAAC